jgi:hypothetical protein
MLQAPVNAGAFFFLRLKFQMHSEPVWPTNRLKSVGRTI